MKASLQPATPAPGKSSPRWPGQVLKLFAAAVFLAFSLPLVFLASLLGWRQYRILTTWPTVDAVVTRADRTTATTRGGRQPITAYSARFSFRYTAAGRLYQSSAEVGRAAVASQADRWLRQMPVGSHTRLRYDPRDPAAISLAADNTQRAFAVPLLLAKWAALATALAAGLLFLGWRSGRRKPGVARQ